jgi:hypothetical protein
LKRNIDFFAANIYILNNAFFFFEPKHSKERLTGYYPGLQKQHQSQLTIQKQALE